MNLNEALVAELQHEASSTRKMLERVPTEKFGWKPHEKSMSLGRLASHVAGLTFLAEIIMRADEMDFMNTPYKLTEATDSAALLQLFDNTLATAVEALKSADDERLRGQWTLRRGEQIIFQLPRIAAYRTMVVNHFIHHRGQLSVYLRLLDIPVPGMYGPSADEARF
jgi:uncharacterized damage-inducible protein DinB